MKIFKIYFLSSAITLLLFSCGVDKPDMGSNSASQADDYESDSDISDSDSYDSSHETNDSDNAGADSEDENNHNQQNDSDFAGKNDDGESQDFDFSEGEYPDPSEDDDLEETADLDEDTDPSADDDHEETADSDEQLPNQNEPQFINGNMQNWVDDLPLGWKKSEGALATLKLEKETSGNGESALRVTQPQNSRNKPGFESDEFETFPETPLPQRIEFKLKTGALSKIASELVCGENSLKYKYADDTKTFIKSSNYSYNQIEISDWTGISIEFGDEMTEDFWRNQLCRLSFRTGSGADFDVSFDDFKIIY
ncbi:hypothetical protein IJG44_01335 [bacterium]|nr:hypothetical protein [bacterium]